MPLALQSIEQMGILALTVIPLLCLYFGLIAWLTYDAAQDSNWVFWLLVFLLAGPVSIPFYIFVSMRARRGTSQEVLDARAEARRQSPYKFVSEIERFKWIENLDPVHGTMYEPALGLSLPRGRHEKFRDHRAEELLTGSNTAALWDYLTGMYAIALEQGDVERTAGFGRYIERLPNGAARLAHWELHGTDLEVPDAPPLSERLEL